MVTIDCTFTYRRQDNGSLRTTLERDAATEPMLKTVRWHDIEPTLNPAPTSTLVQ